MIKTLRRRIVLITLLSVGLVLGVLVTGMNLANYHQVLKEADDTLAYLAEHEGRFPGLGDPNRPMRPEAQFDTRYFSVLFNEDYSLAATDLRKIFAVSQEEAVSYAFELIQAGLTKGTLDNYRYLIGKEASTTRVMFLDIERSLEAFQSFLYNSIIISLVGMLLVLGLALIFSKILLRPVEEAYQKQRQFITDASHELKTPITIIKANMEVLELTQEKNQWVESTNRQADRMASLASDLLFLARMDEAQSPAEAQEFDLKELLEETIQDYQPLISENFNLKLELESLVKKLDKDLIKRLFNVLIENSLNYGIPGEEIRIELKEGKNKTLIFRISNQAQLDRQGSYDELFDRFTRNDQARNQAQGGSGIGLSIAKSIVDYYRGKIKAYSPDSKNFIIELEL